MKEIFCLGAFVFEIFFFEKASIDLFHIERYNLKS